MKIFLFCILMILNSKSFSQTDTLAPYQQFPFIPPFKIQLTDSSWFTKYSLSDKRSTWVIYFSPDCGHCQQVTEEIITNIKSLKNIQIVMIASRPFEDVKHFHDHFMMKRYSNIKVGIDPTRMITNFYKVQHTPFSALYDRKGELIKAFKDAPTVDEIVRLAR